MSNVRPEKPLQGTYPALKTPLRACACVGECVLVGFPNDPSKKPIDHRFGAVLLLHDFQNQ